MSNIKIGFIVKPQVDKGDRTDNFIITNPRSAMAKANEILNKTYKPAVITELTMDGEDIVSTRLVEFEITVVAVED